MEAITTDNEPAGEVQGRVAIIGMAGRFPGASDVTAFWQNLRAGVESITFFTAETLRARGVDAALLDDPHYVRACGRLEGVERFDADFFGFTPREAEITDPQQRLFLECAWTALEHSGYDSQTAGARIAVYAGTGLSTYLLNNLLANPRFLRSVDYMQVLIGNNKDYMPTRVSYKLDLRGASLNVSTACSTSLVAVHLACQALLDYQCDMALAGGASIQVPQDRGYPYIEGGIASPDGHCRAFDARAQGTVTGNGVAVVVLKRLADALADSDHIYAVIVGSAVNNDGAAKVGYTAPSVQGQAEVIAEALALAGFAPETITYVETHGTGTVLGDPIEIEALTQAFRAGTQRLNFCAIGSVKTNVGHLDEAAGVASLIKTALALYHREIPPSLHFQRPNPRIDFAASPFFVNTRLRPWDTKGLPRRAGVSSFGIGGTNAHVVLEEAPPLPPAGLSRPYQLLLLSARTPTALERLGANLDDYLQAHPEVNLADVAYTLHVGRRAFPHRRMRIYRTPARADGAWISGQVAEGTRRTVAFLFPGQGSQHLDMGKALYYTEPAFREQVDRCAELLRPQLGLDLRAVLYLQERTEAAEQALRQTALAQPALFVIEYALARLWMRWGIQPAAMLGHSLGEYVAACLAEVFSLEDALALVAARGQLLQQLPAGAMLAVPLSEAELLPWLDGALSLAAVNGPAACVAAGPTKVVAALRERLAMAGIKGVPLATSHAFHSAMIEPVLAAFEARVREVTLCPPMIPYLSNVTGAWIRPEEATDSLYWARHLRQSVRFEPGLRQLLQDPECVLLEVGPGRTLTSLATAHPQRAPTQPLLHSLPHPRQATAEDAFLLSTLGGLWLAGMAVDWAGFHTFERRQRLPLPTYPFEDQRYWVEPAPGTEEVQPQAAAADPIAGWFYWPQWRQMAPVRPTWTPAHWLVFTDALGLGERLAKRLRRDGRDVVCVSTGTGFAQVGPDRYTLAPGRQQDYTALVQALAAASRRPDAIIHLWNVTPLAAPDPQALAQAAETGFHSLLCLARALGSGEVTINVVSSHMQAVTEDGTLCPEKAMLLGPVRVIPLEYPHLRLRSIDLALPTDAADDEWLLAECAAGAGAAVVAYRDGERWEQTFAPLSWPDAGLPARLRHQGVYLITGGLGSMGLAFAEYLARRVEARLVLVGRTLLPEDEAACVAQLEASLEQALGIPGLDAWPGLEERLNAFCAALIGAYFRACGVDFTRGRHRRAVLKAKLGLLPQFERFLDFCLGVLAEEGVITLRGDAIEAGGRLPLEAAALQAELSACYPQFKGLIELLAYCASHYRAALSGAMEAIHVLYPEGSSELLDHHGRETAEYANDRLYLSLAGKLIAGLAGSERRLRILEVGAGTGTLTHHVLEALGTPANVEYHFTDIGQGFVLKARQEAARRGLEFVHCGRLDITEDPEPQGYQKGSFDVVLAYNVVHATSRVAATLDNLKALLCPGGLLLLVETVKALRWNDLIWGLAEGWWCFADSELRTRSPLLSLGQWEAVLQGCGFVDTVGYPRDPARRQISACGLLIARRPGPRDLVLRAGLEPRLRARLKRLEALRETGAEILVLQADVADWAQLEAAVARAREHFGTIHGVIHTAGVLGQGLIHTKTREQAERVMAPKVQGAWHVVRAVEALRPDFLVLCSSLSALTPIIGQVDYCAANAFLDALAHYQTRRGVFTVAIDWGFWQELGMIEDAATVPEAKRAVAEEIRREGLGEAGVRVLERVLGHGALPQIIVSPRDFCQDLAGPREGDRPSPVRRAVPHPLFDHRRVEGPDLVSYVTLLSPRWHWVIDEHRVMDQPTLPGTAYLELARAAFAHHRGAAALELREVYFLSPLTLALEETRELRTLLKDREDGCTFFVISRLAEDRWQEHARGEVHSLEEATPLRALADLAAACAEEAQLPAASASGFGPHWNCLEWIRFGHGEGLASLALPAPFADEAQTYGLHPALLDMATGFMTLKDTLPWGLPFAYRRLVVRQVLPARVYSYARRRQAPGSEGLSFDISLLDEQGQELVTAEGYTLRSAAAETAAYARYQEPAPAAENLGLEIVSPGILDTLALRPVLRRRPGRGEVEIRVHAAGLNFIEVLYALGMLPTALGPEPVRFGLECAGTLTAVGEGVEGLQIGDEVIAYTSGCFGLYTTAAAVAVAHRPAALSREEAATLPAAFTTAWHALLGQGRLKAGERVLIHAAAGGVGLAAVQIARWRGAEILTTAGTEEKRAYLRALGIRHVFDSRSLSFAEGVLQATTGRGVDLVLNALGGEFIAKSLEVLAPYGRFLEIGKRDLLKNTRLDLQPFLKSLSFIVIDVGPQMPDFAEVWAQVLERFRVDDFKPLPYRTFPLTEAAQAFEHMAQARHIGKIVLTIGDTEALRARVVRRDTVGVPLAAIIGEPRSAALRSEAPSEHQRPELSTAYAAPRSRTERALAAIWQALLGIDRIGLHDNFFELKGDSLLAAQVVSRVHTALQIRLPLSSLFEVPTIAELAARIDRDQALEAAPAAALGENEEEGTL